MVEFDVLDLVIDQPIDVLQDEMSTKCQLLDLTRVGMHPFSKRA